MSLVSNFVPGEPAMFNSWFEEDDLIMTIENGVISLDELDLEFDSIDTFVTWGLEHYKIDLASFFGSEEEEEEEENTNQK
jgi:hypothetical protein